MAPPHTLVGNIQYHKGFCSRTLGNRRDVLVYLPTGYRRSLRRRYPVMYFHDGQNVFDAATAFNGTEWGVDETAQRLIRQKLIEPIIIVAISNIGDDRIHEYTPTRAVAEAGVQRKKRSRGLALKYGKFLTQELKPFIDAEYRTKPQREFTGLGGSSLGGLVTMVLGLWWPDVFSRLAVMSPSVWWDEHVILRMIEQLDKKLPLRIWLDIGTAEPGWDRTRALRDALVEKGWHLDDDLQYSEVAGADHSERAWAGRIDAVLRYLYPPVAPTSAAVTTSQVATAG